MNTKNKKLQAWLLTPVLAILTSLCYELFIFPNSFAPAGVGGIATMAQHLFQVNAGLLNLLINIPLLVLAWFLVDREFVGKTALFIVFFSGSMLLFGKMDFSRFCYYTTNGSSTVLAPVAAGTLNGLFYGLAVRQHGSTGGTDIMAACVRRFRPEYDLMWIAFAINGVVAAVSYFVYGYQFEPVVCCIVYCFVSSFMGNRVLKGYDEALKFEIVSQEPELLGKELMDKLGHGVTVLPAEGMYTHDAKSLVICIVNKHQIVDVQRIIARHAGSFAYISTVSSTVGNFRRVK